MTRWELDRLLVMEMSTPSEFTEPMRAMLADELLSYCDYFSAVALLSVPSSLRWVCWPYGASWVSHVSISVAPGWVDTVTCHVRWLGLACKGQLMPD